MHDNTLFAQSFDVDRLQVSGDPVPIMQGIQIATEGGSGLYAVSDAGTFAYLPDQVPQSSSGPVLWMDRAGRTATMRAAAAQWNNPRFSPDGRRLALDITTNGNTDIWVYDWERDQMLRLTNDPAEERRLVWTPDGSRIVFARGVWAPRRRGCIGSALMVPRDPRRSSKARFREYPARGIRTEKFSPIPRWGLVRLKTS